jgi:molybdopterin-guanine dinucleotide biosynthesis protein A
LRHGSTLGDGATFTGVFDAIVLAGGRATRLGGADKPALALGNRSLLELVVAAVDDAARVIVVGPTRPLTSVRRAVQWYREDPPGGGPVAGLAAGLKHVAADVVVILAADLPSIAPAVAPLLAALAAGPADWAALVDDGGRVNYLAAAWRRVALQQAMAALGEVSGASMRALTAGATLAPVPDTQGWGLDCDTWGDVDEARRRLNPEGTP